MTTRLLVLALLVALARPAPADVSARIDLTDALIYQGPFTKHVLGTGEVLATLVRSKTGLYWPVINDPAEAKGRPLIAVGNRDEGVDWTGPFAARLGDGRNVEGPEGFRIETDAKEKSVVILGNDDGGTIRGIGRFLRAARLTPGHVMFPVDFRTATAPKVKLRGHQLGYRPKTNSYDGWDVAQWARYIGELAVFGTNAIELVPPRSDDDRDSPHFTLPPLAMMEKMSRAADLFEMAVWIWFPVMDPVDVDPSRTEPLLKEWSEVFHKLPRVDAVFVPGGDPGKIPPKPLFAFLEKAAKVLKKDHPKATIWVSPQGFDQARFDEFLTLVKAEPGWLAGVVHGPQVRVTPDALRELIPKRYPIRSYPDITHSRQCQHPVPDWDLAYALTEGRESVNPRPLAQAAILRSTVKSTIGFLSYSEGCNDDVNKFVWSALGWDPDANVVDVLREYAAYLIDPEIADPFAQSLLSLERNWSGPLLTNSGVETTLRQLQDIERTAPPRVRQNWRFQQALYRAYYDAYLRDRLKAETSAQDGATEALRRAPEIGSELALKIATERLEDPHRHPLSTDRRARVFALGEALFESVHMQLSVDKHLAIDPERGGNLDTIDAPLNDRLWLLDRFAEVRGLPSEPERIKAIDAIVNRTDPGPGGFYDDPGDPARQPHLVKGPGYDADPSLFHSAWTGFSQEDRWPAAWRHYAMSFYDAPITMRYEGLDPNAHYRVKVTYSGDSPKGRIRLDADGVPVHGLLIKPNPVAPIAFPIPATATADGRLELTWHQEPGRGGNGRGCQVGEVWLLREGP